MNTGVDRQRNRRHNTRTGNRCSNDCLALFVFILTPLADPGRGQRGPCPASLLVRLWVLEYLNIQTSTEYSTLGIRAANRRLITELKCVQGCLFVKLLIETVTETSLR